MNCAGCIMGVSSESDCLPHRFRLDGLTAFAIAKDYAEP